MSTLQKVGRDDIAPVDSSTNTHSTGMHAGKGLEWPSLFTQGDPYNDITWEKRDAQIKRGDGSVVFEQKDVEVPSFWSQTAVDIVASKYFRGAMGSPEREGSAKQLIDRVANTISGWGFKDGYFKTKEDHERFRNDLRYILINQFSAFNSPVWFNVGVYERPQCSACFILEVQDNMESILNWYADEGRIFKYGSGSGTNLSNLRSSKEKLSKGGTSSGPVSFMKGADGVALAIKSGGTTRRAAKMVVLNVDHPDIYDFINCKRNVEEMVRILESGGVHNSIEGELFTPYAMLPYQTANNSVRVTDEFMQAVESNGDWDLKAASTGETVETIKAQDLMNEIADAAWHSADPGIQFDTIINDWHTCPNTGRINASNPCSEYMHIDNSACNLSSINLLKYLREDGTFDLKKYKDTIRTMITAQEIIVSNSFYPTPKVEKNSHDFRQLGLGYANLGALLMNMGLAYDSDEGRTIAAALTSILTGEGYAQSARISEHTGPFNGYELNKEPMLNVIKKHGQAAKELAQSYHTAIERSNESNGAPAGLSEGVPYVTMNGSTPKVTLHKATAFPLMQQQWVKELMDESQRVWEEAHELGTKHGVRNSQATVIAPTGTIAFMMDCDTTGIEPPLAVVSYKKLVAGGTLKLVNKQVAPALAKLGYTEQQIKDIDAYILENEMIEGAPHIKPEHMPVFDCSFKAANGTRSISHVGHVKMMSATQPFISGAISKTVNMPFDATVEDVKEAYIQAWKLGLKAIAIYRDGSKSVQPMSTSDKDKELIEQTNGHTRVKLPDERPSVTHRFSIGNHKGYLTTGLYPESGKPAETFITVAKEGSTVSGLMDAIATLTSIALQSGVPLKTLVAKFKNMRFEPMGPTSNNDIPFATSFIDYIYTYLGHKFLSKEEQEELFGKSFENGVAQLKETAAQVTAETASETTEPQATLASAPAPKTGWEEDSGAQTDAPTCECGTIMFRAGSCYSCPNCFATTGVCN